MPVGVVHQLLVGEPLGTVFAGSPLSEQTGRILSLTGSRRAFTALLSQLRADVGVLRRLAARIARVLLICECARVQRGCHIKLFLDGGGVSVGLLALLCGLREVARP